MTRDVKNFIELNDYEGIISLRQANGPGTMEISAGIVEVCNFKENREVIDLLLENGYSLIKFSTTPAANSEEVVVLSDYVRL